MDPVKVQAIQDWTQPTSLKSLQKFLGFANFYRRFICNFSSIARPLTDLTKKGADLVNWSSAAVEAFQELKRRFCCAPVLCQPDVSLPFQFEVDASEIGAGAVLSQRGQVESSDCPGVDSVVDRLQQIWTQVPQNNFLWQSPIPCSSSLPATCTTGQSKVVAWLQDSEEMDKCAEDLSQCQSNLIELSKLLHNLEMLQRTQSAPNFIDMQANCIDMSKRDKRTARRWRTKSVSKDAKIQLQVPLSASMSPIRLHASNPNLYADVEFQNPPSHVADALEFASDYTKLQEEFCLLAQKVHSLLKSAYNTIAIEKEKMKQMVSEQDYSNHNTQITRLRQSLSQALNHNSELRSRLNRIHTESVISDQVVSVNIISSPDEPGEHIHVNLPLSPQVSNEGRLSMSESVSEFFDAQEVLLSASSSENEASDDESYISDVSDNISEDNTSVADNVSRQILNGELLGGAFRTGRRTSLPTPSPDTSNINLWNILRNNIGKDLSKVSMPVELNEPLNTLQHLCEELEYSELLDKASETDDPHERMVQYIFTF
ncbi:unnamed protein product [Ranitomeya imitator]|uniref:Reverse transcriptase/retrotransposon-derived protein RNase H-like domain-containing protein n=1 Tax=Ranitomeya imitator TaxID=111125 RepID=A0ABN9LJR1_9NEOB|nr:unnamed protein product [Ranitomeya imitator]